MIRSVIISTPDLNDLIGCGVCPKECRLIDGAICRSGVRRRVGDRVVQLNYGMLLNLRKGTLPMGFREDEEGLFVSMIGGNHKLAFDPDWGLSQFYQERSREIGKFEAMRSVETSGDHYAPAELVEYSQKHDLEKIFFFNGEPAVNLDYILELSRVARRAGIEVYIKSRGTIPEQYWYALTSDLSGVSLHLDSLDNSYNQKYFNIRTDHILELLKYLSKPHKLRSIYTTIIPDVNDRARSLDRMVDIFNHDIDQNVDWIVRSFTPDHKMWDRRSIADEDLSEIINYLTKICRMNIIADTGKIDR